MALTYPKFTPPPLIGGAGTLTGPGQGEATTQAPYFEGGVDPSGFFGSLGKSFQQGVKETGLMAGSFGNLKGVGILRALGKDDLADKWLWDFSQYQLSTGADIGELERQISLPTRLGEIDGVGSTFKYGMYAIAKQAPQLTLQFATSIAAGLIGGPGAAGASFLATSYILGAGEVYSSALAETGDAHIGASLAAGIPIALLERLPFARALRRMGKGSDYGNWLAREVTKPKWKRAISGSMKTGIQEGTTEAFQNVIEQMTVDYVSSRGLDIGEILRSEEFAESGAQGLAVGLFLGPLAAAGGTRGLPPPTVPERPLDTDTVTQEAADALQGEALAEEGQRILLREQTRQRRILGQSTRRPDPEFATTGIPTVQEQAETIVTSAGLETFDPTGRTPVRRRGMPTGPATPRAPDEGVAPRDKSRRQKDRDGAYDRQLKEVDKLGEQYKKNRAEGIEDPSLLEDLAIAQLRLRVFALEAASHDLETGGEGRTKDGLTIEEIVVGGRPWKINIGPIADAIPLQLYNRIQDAFRRGDVTLARQQLSLIESNKARGLGRVGRVGFPRLRETEAQVAVAREADEQLRDRVAEALISIPLFDAAGKKIKGAKAQLVEMLREMGVGKEQIGVPLTAGLEKVVAGINTYIGEERSAGITRTGEEARVEGEAATRDQAVVDEIKELEAAASLERSVQRQAERRESERETEAARVQAEEDQAILIRDTMEREDGSWRDIAPRVKPPEGATTEEIRKHAQKIAQAAGHITFADLRDLASQMGVTVSNRKIEDIYKDLAAVADRQPFTKQELAALATVDEGVVPEERATTLKRREQEAKEKIIKEEVPEVDETKKWDLLNLLNIGLPGLTTEDAYFQDWMGVPQVPKRPTETIDLDSQIWYRDLFSLKGKVSVDKIVNNIISYINGEINLDSEGKLVPQQRKPSFGIKFINHEIQKANVKKEEKNRKPLLQLVDTKSDEPLAWDLNGRTSSQLKEDIRKQIEAVYAEPDEVVTLKEKIHQRLIEKAKNEKGEELTKGEIADLKPVFVAPNGRYVLEPRKVTVRPATTVAGKKRPEIVARKTSTQDGLLVAYNENDELLGMQDFNQELAEMAKAELDILREKYNIKKGSRKNNWNQGEGRPEEQQKALRKSVILIFTKYGIPLKGTLTLKDHKGKTLFLNMSDLGVSAIESLMAIENIETGVVYDNTPDNVFNGFSSPPVITKVFKGEKGDMPDSLKPFMKWNKEMEAWLHKPANEEQSLAFGEAFAKLSEKEQKDFTSRWTYESPEVTLTLRAKERKASIWNSIPVYPYKLKGEPAHTAAELEELRKTPRLMERLEATGEPVSLAEEIVLRGRDIPVTADERGAQALAALNRFLTDPKKFFAGKVIKGRITNYVPAMFERNSQVARPAEDPQLDWTYDTIAAWDQVSEEVIEFTDNEGLVHKINKDDILSMDEVAADVILPQQTEMQTSALVEAIDANLIHGRERRSSFLQRMSDPALRVTDRINYYIKPEEIVVGSKVTIRSEETNREIESKTDYYYENRRRLRFTDDPARNLVQASRQEIKELYLSNPPWGSLQIRTLGKWHSVRPPQGEEKKIYTVDRIYSRDYLGDTIYLDGRPKLPYKRADLEPVLFPAVSGLRTTIETEVDEAGNFNYVITESPDVASTAEFKWAEGIREELLEEAAKPSPSLRPQDVRVGDKVRLLPGVEVTVLKEGYETKPGWPFEISKRGLEITLRDPFLNEDVVRVKVSQIAPRSLNSPATLNAAREQRRLLKNANVKDQAQQSDPWYMVPEDMPSMDQPVIPEVVPEEGAIEEVDKVRMVEAGLYEVTTTEGKKYKIEKFKGIPGMMLPSWKLSRAVKEGEEYDFSYERTWEWMETYGTLAAAKRDLNDRLKALDPAVVTPLTEQLNVAPTRRWVNEYGVSIEEFPVDQKDTHPDSPQGHYYEVYRPEAWLELEITERFYDPLDPINGLQKAFDKYASKEFYEGLSPAAWIHKQRTMRAEELGTEYPLPGIGPGLSYTLRDGALVRADRIEELSNASTAFDEIGNPVDEPMSHDDVLQVVADLENESAGVETDLGAREEADPESLDFDKDQTDDIMYSLVQENETTDGLFPQRLLDSTGEQGTTAEELADALLQHFGQGIFNIVKVVDEQGQLPPTINTNAPIRAVTFNNTVWMVAEHIPAHRVVPVAMHEIGAHGFQSIMGRKQYMSLLGEIARMVHTDPLMQEAHNAAKAALLKTHPQANEWLILEETMAYYAEANAPTTNTFWNTLVLYVMRGLNRLKLFITPEMKGWQVMTLIRSSLQSHVEATKGDAGADRVFEANFLNQPLYQTSEEREPAFLDEDAAALANMLPDRMVPDWIAREVPVGRGISKFFKVNWVPREAKKGQQLTFPAWMAGRPAVRGKERFWIGPGIEVHRALFDYFAVMEGYERAIVARGGTVTIAASRVHNAYKNISNDQRKAFRREYIDPLTKLSAKYDIDTNDLHAYMYAQHAVHENAIKKREFKDRPSSGIWSTIEEAAKDNDRLPSAEGYMVELERRLGKTGIGHLQEAAQLVHNMNDFRLTIMRDNGLITQNDINAWLGQAYTTKSGKRIPANRAKQDWAATWVPLRGDNVNIAFDMLADPKRPGGFGIKGPESKKRFGRQSPAESTWAWSIQMAMNTIDRVEKNKVDMSLANLIMENRELLDDQMMVISEDDIKSTKGRDPETKKPFLGLYENVQNNAKHKISFKQNGKQWHILVKDERLGRAFNRTNVMQTNWFLDILSAINRYFAMINTTLSPQFILTNFSRDYQTALHNLLHETETRKGLSSDRAVKLAKQVTRNAWKATRGLHRYITKDLSDTEWAALAKEFSENGGRIDFYGYKNASDVENKVNRYIKEQNRKGYQKGFKAFTDLMGDVNASVENTMRLSTYAAVKQEFIRNGMTENEAIAESADVARNLTVNFTMKGELTPMFNSLYLFFNAGTAGSFRAMTSYNKSRKVRNLAKGVFAFSLANSLALYFLSGDDEDGENRYAKIPMDQRHRNMYIYIPGIDGFTKIPLAYGFNMPYVLGDTLIAMGMGQINPWRAAVHVVTSTMQSFFPMDVANSDRFIVQLAKTATPTAGDAVVDLLANENWSGNPISPVPFPGTAAEPPAYRAWSSTSAPSKFITDWANRLLGPRGLMPGGEKPRLGTRYEKPIFNIVPPPTFLDYVYNTYGGSLGRFFKDSGNMMVNVWARGKLVPRHKEDLSVAWNKVPIVRSFYLDEFLTKKWHVNDQYNIYREEIGASTNFAKGLLAEFGTESEQWREFKKSKNYEIVKLDPIRSSIHGSITKLYKARAQLKRNRLINNDVKEEKILAIEKRIMELKKKFITIFNQRMGTGVPAASPISRLLRAAA